MQGGGERGRASKENHREDEFVEVSNLLMNLGKIAATEYYLLVHYTVMSCTVPVTTIGK